MQEGQHAGGLRVRQPWEQNPEAWKYTPEEIADIRKAQRRALFAAQEFTRQCDQMMRGFIPLAQALQRFTDAVVVEELTRGIPGEES